MRILIIEDEPEVASALAEVLTVEGHRPTVARTGSEGLARIAADAPQAVFLDVKLPGGTDGVEVLRRIRQRDPGLPVVILTGHASREELAAARKLGVTEVLKKPWALNHLDQALAGLRSRGAAPPPSG
ncbi:MAG TPA: response regulator [Methylomirabilota bacterium]